MADLKRLEQNLRKKGYLAAFFETAQEAADYLNGKIDGTTVGFGGSCTLDEMGLYDSLGGHNTVYWHWRGDTLPQAATAKVYLTSMNGVAETGELINIDGTGNRVAQSIIGPEKVYIVVGRNKVEPDFERALYRARNVAAPKNAVRLKRNTPCAVKGDKCYDCSSPERICKALSVFWGPPKHVSEVEVVLVNEALGY